METICLYSLIWKTLSKIRKQSSSALLITPLWSRQSWLPVILQNVIKKPITFSSKDLQLLGTNNKHPLYSKLKLVAFLLSNSTSEHKTYLTQQRKLFWPYGEQKLKTDTTQDTRNGRNFVVTYGELETQIRSFRK